MRAWAVVEAEKPLKQIEIPTPEPRGTQVLVEVTHCGVCHSDVHFWEGFLDLGGPQKTPISAMLNPCDDYCVAGNPVLDHICPRPEGHDQLPRPWP